MSNVTKDFGLQRFSVGNDYLPNKLQINYLYLSWTSEINIWRCYGVSYLYSIFEGFLEVFDHWFVIAATFSKKTYKSLLEHLLIIVIHPKVSKIYQIPDPKSGGVNWTPRCHRRILEEWVFGKGIAFQTWNCVVASSSLTPVGVSSIRIHKIRSTAIIWGPRHHLLGTETLT